MIIYKVEQGVTKPGRTEFEYFPTVKYFHSYVDALAMRGNHNGELSKYEDCHDSGFANREIWIERNLPDMFPGLCQSPKENILTYIHQIEVN